MTFEEKMKTMKEYLLLKFHEEDWHGVSDAANDIRDIVAVEEYKISTKMELTKERRDYWNHIMKNTYVEVDTSKSNDDGGGGDEEMEEIDNEKRAAAATRDDQAVD